MQAGGPYIHLWLSYVIFLKSKYYFGPGWFQHDVMTQRPPNFYAHHQLSTIQPPTDMTKPRSGGAMMSKVGNPQIYEDHEQRPPAGKTDHNLPKKHVPDQWHVDIDQLGEREIGEKMAEAHQHSLDIAHGQGTMSPGADPKVDPLGPATFHGNEPSKGAKIDAEIMAEEHEELKRKGKA